MGFFYVKCLEIVKSVNMLTKCIENVKVNT